MNYESGIYLILFILLNLFSSLYCNMCTEPDCPYNCMYVPVSCIILDLVTEFSMVANCKIINPEHIYITSLLYCPFIQKCIILIVNWF